MYKLDLPMIEVRWLLYFISGLKRRQHGTEANVGEEIQESAIRCFRGLRFGDFSACIYSPVLPQLSRAATE